MENHSMIKNSIILVPFPFDDFSDTKVRPDLCLTGSIGEFDHIVIAFISSKVPEFLEESEISFTKENPGFQDTGLLVDSVLKLHRLTTIPKFLIPRKLGSITPLYQQEVQSKLKLLFGIKS
jgi:mRNA interferase MazF